VKSEVQSVGRDRRSLFRPLEDNYRGDFIGAVSSGVGAGIGALLFDSDALIGVPVVAGAIFILRALHRLLKPGS